MLVITCKFINTNDPNILRCEYCSVEIPSKFKNVYRDCNKQLQPPPLLQRILNFTAAATKHAIAGNPVVSEEVLKQRLDLCRACELYKPNNNAVGGVCTHETCGCNIQDNLNYLNKIAWADQKCPIGKWDKGV
jgi:hypothetical protein